MRSPSLTKACYVVPPLPPATTLWARRVLFPIHPHLLRRVDGKNNFDGQRMLAKTGTRSLSHNQREGILRRGREEGRSSSSCKRRPSCWQPSHSGRGLRKRGPCERRFAAAIGRHVCRSQDVSVAAAIGIKTQAGSPPNTFFHPPCAAAEGGWEKGTCCARASRREVSDVPSRPTRTTRIMFLTVSMPYHLVDRPGCVEEMASRRN